MVTLWSYLTIIVFIFLVYIIIKKVEGDFFMKVAYMMMAILACGIGGPLLYAIFSALDSWIVILLILAVIGSAYASFADGKKKKEKSREVFQQTKKHEPSVAGKEELLRRLNGIQVGQTIPFGPYDWNVLDICGNEALLYTSEVIMEQKYHKRLSKANLYWGNCSLRQYLNGSFFSQSFSLAESELIIEKEIPNCYYKLSYGRAPEIDKTLDSTRDRVFPLSIAEDQKYRPEPRGSYGYDRVWLRDCRAAYGSYSPSPIIFYPGSGYDQWSSTIETGVRVAMWVRIR